MAEEVRNILIGGEAGQGLATVGQGLAKALVRGGYHLVMTQSYLSRIRGGHNTMALRTGCREILAGQEPVDLLVALDQESLDRHRGELSPGGLAVLDEALDPRDAPALKVPLKALAGGARQANTAALGVAAALLGLDQALLAGVLEALFGKKDPAVAQGNAKVLAAAYAWLAGRRPAFEPLGSPPLKGPRLMLAGNEALALGAIHGGAKFLSFYPMTPATSVALTFVAQAERLGLVAEQAEDEIAAVNLAIGASFAGAPALVATSGGGFALMAEGVSLAAMTETPLVIVVAMRPGPATGLPTRTEQGDLDFVLHAGHGEFPRAILAPGTPEECFHLARRAMALAEEFQGPVFILTDQFLADSYRSVAPFDPAALPPAQAPLVAEPPEPAAYARYALTESGVSPRALPGRGEALVVADSDEHDERGHLTEDLGLRVAMHEKRLRKMTGLRERALPPSFIGDEQPELLLVCWGSAQGATREAAATLRAKGRKVGVCHFGQVWPLNEESFLARFEAAGMVVAVEGNASGQFAKLIRRETGFAMSRLILRYDGLPLTPEYILAQLAKW